MKRIEAEGLSARVLENPKKSARELVRGDGVYNHLLGRVLQR
jgi:hypothetical protein